MIFFFSKRKPRQFNYTPRHFDPEKEARDARRREILGAEAAAGYEDKKSDYKPGQYVRGVRMDRYRNNHGDKKRVPMVRVIIMLALLGLLAYFLLSSDFAFLDRLFPAQ